MNLRKLVQGEVVELQTTQVEQLLKSGYDVLKPSALSQIIRRHQIPTYSYRNDIRNYA